MLESNFRMMGWVDYRGWGDGRWERASERAREREREREIVDRFHAAWHGVWAPARRQEKRVRLPESRHVRRLIGPRARRVLLDRQLPKEPASFSVS